MIKEKYLIFTGFVGGYGGIAKTKRFVAGLQERGINPILVTEERYKKNLVKFGLRPDIIVPIRDRIEDNYAEVSKALNPIDYEIMISFGPRTFGPKHAIDTGRKAVIIDGGLPPFLGELDSDHVREVYQSLDDYILTCHFPWNPPLKVLSGYPDIPIRVLSQPVDDSTRQSLVYYQNMTESEITIRKKSFCLRHGHEYRGELLLPVRMSSSLLDENNLEENGGWLKRSELDQTKLFLEHLITTLGKTSEQAIIPINAKIARRFKSLLADYPNIAFIPLSFLPPEECLELSRIADLNIDRAVRDVTQFEIAASGSYGIVCPCPTQYMHEDISAEWADQRGIIRNIPITTPDLGSRILDYVGSDHYRASRKIRICLWEEMHSAKNIIDVITREDKTRKRPQYRGCFKEATGAFQCSS